MNQDILMRPKQSRVNIDKPAGRVNAFGYRRIQAKGRDYPAHWLVWLYFKGKWPNGEVDHIDGEKHYLGSFSCSPAAHLSYQIATDNLHGEFARAP